MVSARALVKKVVFDRVPGLLRRGPSNARRVALTFDDGPDDLTPRYLDTLDKLHVPASFFLIGNACQRRPELVREYVRRGHHIAAHGYDHTRFTKLDRRALLDQCDRTDRELSSVWPGRAWVRPPYGAVDASTIVSLRLAGYTVALWSLDSHDYEDRDPAVVASRCAPMRVHNGDVLLFHEGQPWTLDALPSIIERLRGSGFDFVTMRDLYAR
nr:polysaccharide deacetylase family protein [Kofleriaceae bacterium]